MPEREGGVEDTDGKCEEKTSGDMSTRDIDEESDYYYRNFYQNITCRSETEASSVKNKNRESKYVAPDISHSMLNVFENTYIYQHISTSTLPVSPAV